MRKQRPSASPSLLMVLASSLLVIALVTVQLAHGRSLASSSTIRSGLKSQLVTHPDRAPLSDYNAAMAQLTAGAPPPPIATPPPPPPPPPAPAPLKLPAPSPSSSGVASDSSSSLAGGVWAALRQCESDGNYQDNTGNGFYGAYQFTQETWTSLGYPGRPDQASPATQDAAAKKDQSISGWGQWPACSRKLGLN